MIPVAFEGLDRRQPSGVRPVVLCVCFQSAVVRVPAMFSGWTGQPRGQKVARPGSTGELDTLPASSVAIRSQLGQGRWQGLSEQWDSKLSAGCAVLGGKGLHFSA